MPPLGNLNLSQMNKYTTMVNGNSLHSIDKYDLKKGSKMQQYQDRLGRLQISTRFWYTSTINAVKS